MLTEGEQDASSQRTPPALSALAELRPKATRGAQSTADPARAPGPIAHLPTSCSHAAGQARSSRRATINCSSPCARPAPASMIAHIWRTDVKVVRLLFHAVGPAVDGGAAATRPTPRRLQLAYSCRTAADSRRMPCEPLPPTPRTTARGRSAVQRQLPAPRAALPAPHAAAGAVPAAPAAGLPPLRTAALSPRPPGQNGTGRDGAAAAAQRGAATTVRTSGTARSLTHSGTIPGGSTSAGGSSGRGCAWRRARARRTAGSRVCPRSCGPAPEPRPASRSWPPPPRSWRRRSARSPRAAAARRRRRRRRR